MTSERVTLYKGPLNRMGKGKYQSFHSTTLPSAMTISFKLEDFQRETSIKSQTLRMTIL